MDFSIKHDHDKIICYSPIQSDYAKRTLDKKYIDDMNTVVVKKDNKIFTKSKAAFVVLDELNHPLRYFQFILPSFLADKLYYFVAERRYSWFGKKEACSFPNNNSQFLVD
jgi:predicted DCC family thiol-disulfide oxidoreductase YuxK